VTALYFIALYDIATLVCRLLRIGVGPAMLRLSCEDGRGVLLWVLERCTRAGFSVAPVDIDSDGKARNPGVVDVVPVVSGPLRRCSWRTWRNGRRALGNVH
jgi:hypothetical protein